MPLTGKQVSQLRDALLDAYQSADELRMMVRIELGENLNAIAGGENLRVLTFNLVSWAEQAGRVNELLESASRHNPGNQTLQQLVAEWRAQTLSHIIQERPSSSDSNRTPTGPVSIDVFLSYSRKDSNAMVQVREALRAAGLSVWTDEGLEPGTSSWQNAISEAVRQASAMVVLLSPNSNASTWVNNEIGFAQTLRKRILPVLIAGDETNSVPINLINAQRVNGKEGELGKVVIDTLLPLLGYRQQPVSPSTMPDTQPIKEAVAPPVPITARPVQPRSVNEKERTGRTSYRGFVLTAAAVLLVGVLAYYLAERSLLPAQTADTTPAGKLTTSTSNAEQATPSPTAVAMLGALTSTTVPAGVVASMATTTAIVQHSAPAHTAVATSPAAPKGATTNTPRPTLADTAMSTSTSVPTATNSPQSPEPQAGTVREFKGVPFVYVPAGEFKMGSDPNTDSLAQDSEQPQHTLTLPGFWVMRTEVTNEQYTECVDANACTPPDNHRWNDPSYSMYPVTDVDWNQANAYARWFGGRLPTEAEWEKACKGTDGRLYPWGDSAPTADLTNFNNNVGDTMPVGKYSPQGDSLYGLADMAGNVYEWTSSQFEDYPYDADDGRENPEGDAVRTLRGGSWGDNDALVRCARRFSHGTATWDNYIGFRLSSPGF